jgi:hypothetical protein
MKPVVLALPLVALLMLTACEKMQQKGPPPTVAQPAASAASAPAPKP